jgi:hypothetical protein
MHLFKNNMQIFLLCKILFLHLFNRLYIINPICLFIYLLFLVVCPLIFHIEIQYSKSHFVANCLQISAVGIRLLVASKINKVQYQQMLLVAMTAT